MNDEITWRTYLKPLISDSAEKQRLVDQIGINQVTLQRWVSGQSNPRPDKLRALLDCVPQHRKQLLVLIQKEFPEFFVDNPNMEEAAQEIPSAFYERVFKTYANNALALRASLINALILQQVLSHLDPHKQGMAAILAPCVPPVPGQKVRSLRQTLGRGTYPWDAYLKHHTLFFGAESPAGYAVAKRQIIVAQTLEEIRHTFPHYETQAEQSLAACPILLSHRMAGSLVIASTQPHYFSQPRLDIIQQYTETMTIAFEPEQFFQLQDIELAIMPSAHIQRPQLAHFHQRVSQLMIEARTRKQFLTRPDAELIIWKQIEHELLYNSWEEDP